MSDINENKNENKQVKEEPSRRDTLLKKKKKKKKIIIFSVIGGVVLIGILIIVVVLIALGNTANMGAVVTTENPAVGEFVSDVEVAGTIRSDKSIHFDAPGNIKISKIATQGAFFKKGETILEFDKDSFEEQSRISYLQNSISENSGKSAEISLAESQSDLAKAKSDFSKYTGLVNSQQAEVDRLTSEITDANALKAAEINNKIYEAQKQLNDFNYLAGEGGVINGLSEKARQTYAKYAKDKSYEIGELEHELSLLTNSAESYQQSKTLSEAQTKLAEYTEEKAKAEATRDSLEKAIGNEYDVANVALNSELSSIQASKSMEAFEQYANGLVAPFDGVVLSVSYTDGDTTQAGTPMLVFASLEDICVDFSVTKNELNKIEKNQKAVVTILGKEYEGEVTQINKVAVTSSTGSPAIGGTLKVLNPDDDICLNLEAKAQIRTAQIDSCMTVPIGAINVDNDGDYVYVLVNGEVEKKIVTTEESGNNRIVITDGLSGEDKVIVSYIGEIREGMPATEMPSGAGVELY